MKCRNLDGLIGVRGGCDVILVDRTDALVCFMVGVATMVMLNQNAGQQQGRQQ
jgi:hypothetical protein